MIYLIAVDDTAELWPTCVSVQTDAESRTKPFCGVEQIGKSDF